MSNTKFYEMSPNFEEAGQWGLAELHDFASASHDVLTRFATAQLVDPGMRLRYWIIHPGRVQDLSFGLLRTPIFSLGAAAVVRLVANDDVQLVETEYCGQDHDGPLMREIPPRTAINLLRHIDCLDLDVSFAGTRGFTRHGGRLLPVVKRTAVTGFRALKVASHQSRIIVSEELKGALEQEGFEGAKFVEVNVT